MGCVLQARFLSFAVAFGFGVHANARDTIVDPRQGYYLAEALPVLVDKSEDDAIGSFAPLGGLGLSLRAGEMVNGWLGFGLQLEGGYAQNNRWQHLYGSFLVETQVAVWRHLAIHAGLGAGFVEATDKKALIDETVGTAGPCYAAGLSYDFFLFDESGFAVAPTAWVHFLPGEGFRTLIAWVGIELAWWSGTDPARSDIAVPASDGQTHQGDTT